MIAMLAMSPTGHAVAIEVTNDPATMVTSKNIWMLVKLSDQEQGIFKQGLCFSVDDPSICLSSWRSSLNPTLVYNQAFHRTGRMFLPGSALSIHLNDKALRADQLGACLAQSHVYVHGLVALKSGKVKPFSVKVPLGHSWWPETAQTTATVAMNVPQAVNCPTVQATIKPPSLKPVADVLQELTVVDSLVRLWVGLTGLVHHMLALALFWHWYAIVIGIWALLALKRRYHWLRFIVPLSGSWEREVRRGLLFVGLLGVVRMSAWWLPVHFCLYAAAVLCGGGMCYASLTPPFEETFLGRLKGLIGFVLGMLILPLLAKAWLLQMGLF
jgi:hypothetical protein